MTTPHEIDPEVFRQRAADGMSSTEMAEEFGCGRFSIMRRAKKLGIEIAGNQNYKRSAHSIRREVGHMRPTEAVEFLLELIDQILPGLKEDHVDLLMEHGFTGSEARLLSMLIFDKMVAKESIYVALYGGRQGDIAEPKIIDVFVCKVRKKIAELGWGFKIVTLWGRGYRGQREDGFLFPWEIN